jgi:hypothetical protein
LTIADCGLQIEEEVPANGFLLFDPQSAIQAFTPLISPVPGSAG